MAKKKPEPVLTKTASPALSQKVAKLCKLQAIVNSVKQAIDELKVEVLMHMGPDDKQQSTSYGLVSWQAGRKTENLSEFAKEKLNELKEELREAHHITADIGDPFLKVQPTVKANADEILERLF